MHNLGGQLVMAIAAPMVALVRNGKRVPTMVGAVLGACLGALAGLVMAPLLPPGMVLGACVGAAAAAGLFPRPPAPLGARTPGESAPSMGNVLAFWKYHVRDFKSLTVLMDRAIYVVRDNEAPWQEVLDKLAAGVDPGLPLGDLIRLDELARIELRKRDATVLQVVHQPGSRLKRRKIDFISIEERDGFLLAVTGQLDGGLIYREQPTEMWRAIRAPLIVLIALSVVVFGGMFLSAYWTAHPPPKIKFKGKQDDLARLLIWAGPRNVLLAGGIPLLAATTWFVSRVMRPPQLQILEPGRARIDPVRF